MRRRIWLMSDPHFNHTNIIKFAGRPFGSVDEMNETIVERCNAVVRPEDHLYVLGDVSMSKSGLVFAKRLNGHKRLITGNHDIFDTTEYMKAGFEKVMGVRVFGNALLSHFPVHPDSLAHRFKDGNIHGHLHEQTVNDPRYENVCVEQTGYAPVELDEVVARIKRRLNNG